MSRKCDLCGKQTVSGNNVSHAKNATRRTWRPNIKKVTTLVGSMKKTIKVCTRCLKKDTFVKA